VNFPKGTPLEIVTPQLEVHPTTGENNLSAIINATPQTEDRFQSRSGDFTVIERQKNGKTSHIMPGQIIVAALLPAVAVSPGALVPIPPPQGPPGGPQIARLSQAAGDVRIARAATPNNFARVAQDAVLAANDFVRTLNGRATVQFLSDNSVITLIEGTTIRVQQQMMANTITRRITQYIGSIWFNISRSTGTQTTLETPTAVAAIRGTQGTQDVPNDSQSTHELNEGLEQITENVTNQSVTLHAGQQVTAYKGIGFGSVLALAAAITQPLVGGGAAAAPAQGGGLTAQGSGIGTSSTVTTVAVVTATAVAVTAGVVAAIVPVAARKTPPADHTTPLNPPGGG
jgi:FecR-like protein